MDEQFDKQLNNRIREVFDNFEDLTADEGWLLLREKFPAKEKDRGIVWLWLGTAAAILLLALGIGTWVNLKKDEPTKLSYKPVKRYQPENNTSNKSQLSVKMHDATKAIYNSKTSIAVNTSPKNRSALIAQKNKLIKTVGKNSTPEPALITSTAESLAADKDANRPVIVNEKPVTTPALINDTATKNSTIAVIPKKSIVKPNILPFSDKPNDTKEQSANESAKKDNSAKKVQFSVYAATYFNYAKGSDNQLNIGAGVTSDIRLTNNLKISTGIAIAQNTLNYAGQPPSETIQAGYLTAFQYGIPNSKATNNAVGYSAPELKNYNAQLVGLDVPVNLKYEFNPQKNASYVSVGLSSGTFINQAYTYQYTYASQQSQTETTNNNFNNFYFAKTLNVSFGLGYPLGKNHLIVEPFLKYPLEGLGAQQIRFGAGGINLKFDFINSKK